MKTKYWDYKTTARTLPSVVYLTNFQLPQSNRLQTVSGGEDLSTNLDEYVDQRPNQVSPPTHPIRTKVQSTHLTRPKMTQQTRRAPAVTHTTLGPTQKMTISSVIKVFKPNKLTT